MFGLMGNQVLSGRWQWDEELKLKDHPAAGEKLPSILERLYELLIQISLKIFVALMWKMMIQSHQNFVHIMTSDLPWHVQNCDMTG